MKFLNIFLMLALAFSVATAQTKKPAKDKAASSVVLKTQGDSISYSIGQNIYGNLKDPGIQLNLNVLIEALKDASKEKSILTQEQIMKVLTALNNKMQERQMAMQKAQEEERKAALAPMIEKNKKEGDAFLYENKKKEGVITTASGLQYKVMSKGIGGPSPNATDKIKINYKGYLLDGNTFDSSKEPVVYPLNQMIQGWIEGLQLMQVGDKYQFFIPSNLAYGDMGRGEVIPPAAVLIFEVELLDIVK